MDEFEIKLDYQFKQRPYADINTVFLGDSRNDPRSGAGVLPYLILHISMLKLSEEKMRVQISKNIDDRTTNKRVDINTVLELDLGFTDDMKDRVKAHEYTLSFISSDKETVSRILISIDEDGYFFVNREKRGKF